MSVINKMLSDLDKKEPQAEVKEEVAFLEAKAESKPKKEPKSKKWWAALISSGVSGVLAVVVGYWYYTQNMQTLSTLDKMKSTVSVPADQNPAKAEEEPQEQLTPVQKAQQQQKVAQTSTEQVTANVNKQADAPANQPKLVVLNNRDENGQSVERKSTLSVQQKTTTPAISQNQQSQNQQADPVDSQDNTQANTQANIQISEQVEASVVTATNTEQVQQRGEEKPTKSGQMSISKVSMSNAERAQKHALQGQKLAQEGMIQPAIEKYQQALGIFPSHQEGRLALAGLYYGRNMVAEALEVLSEGLNIDPGNPDWSLLAAKIHYSRDNFAAALAYLQLPLHPVDNLEYIALKATTLQKLKDYQGAVDVFGQLTVAYPESARWWLGLATSLEGSEKYNQAVDAYRQTLRLGRISQTSRRFVLSRLAQLER